MRFKRRGRAMLVPLAVAVVVAMIPAAASASPAWKFNGTEMASGTSTVLVGAAINSGLTISGLETVCANFVYDLNVSNVAGVGKGEVTELPMYNCTAGPNCTVNSVTAEGLPWASHLTTVGTQNYIVIEGIKVKIVYKGSLCGFSGISVVVQGSAGGLIENSTETATFSKTTFEATKTSLKAIGSPVEWKGLFPTESFQEHRGEKLSVGRS